ncbi:hypothetical protein ACFPU1_16020 [Thalassorhabdus alkalitolerans]|uniref:DUF5590 domain-containing protein n=1 Tax=Thalassorhabdus alkalitolerans TaxID=2282697 RepID=A0ABW0YP32_9BACI|nr:hypothetical protein [Thalassobacillus sp. C254]
MRNLVAILSVAIVVALIVVGILFYQSARSPLASLETRTIEAAQGEDGITSVEEAEIYNGEEQYRVARAINDEGEEEILFYDEEWELIDRRSAGEGVTKGQVRSMVEEAEEGVDIRSVRLGYDQNQPVYEITYRSQEGRFHYYYVTFEDASFVKRYSLQETT